MACYELLGASGNFASIVNNCFGNTHSCETREIQATIQNQGYAVHLWDDRNGMNQANIRNLGNVVQALQ